MKKTQFIEWGIIIVALVFGYKFFESIFEVLIQLLYRFESLDGYLLKMLLVLAMYAVVFILLIRNSGKIAEWLNASSAASDPVPFRLGIRSLLQVVLITICASTILFNIDTVVLYLYDLVREDVGRRPVRTGFNFETGKFAFQAALVKSLVAVLVICFSKDISGWFIRPGEPDELVLESVTEKTNDVHE